MAIVVIAAVLDPCVGFLTPDEIYRDLQFVAHVFYLFRSLGETALLIPSKLFLCSVLHCRPRSKKREVQIADLSRIVDHCVMMTAVYQVALWKDLHVTGGSEGFPRERKMGGGRRTVSKWSLKKMTGSRRDKKQSDYPDLSFFNKMVLPLADSISTTRCLLSQQDTH